MKKKVTIDHEASENSRGIGWRSRRRGYHCCPSGLLQHEKVRYRSVPVRSGENVGSETFKGWFTENVITAQHEQKHYFGGW
jgi:hypothetical protein